MRAFLRQLPLAAKLALGFALVVAVSVGSVAFLANRATRTAFRQYVGVGYEVRASELADELEEYYEEQGSWEGVTPLLAAFEPGGPGMGRGPGGRRLEFLLLDRDGRVVADADGQHLGDRISPSDAALSISIQEEGRQVGTLLVASSEGGMVGLGQQEQGFLDQVNRALLLGGILAGALAVFLGILLASQLTSPIRALNEAAHRIAATDFSSRVPVRAQDEIGDLSQTFNQMAAALEQAERTRQQMTADVAHELRTPVTVIQGHLEAMQDGIFPASADNLQVLLDETFALSRLIEDLRDLSLAESGRLELNRTRVEPSTLLGFAARRFRSMAMDQGVELQLDVPADLPRIRADPQRLQQVLGNLLNNALRHTPRGGQITVSARWVRRGEGTSLPVPMDAPPNPPYLLVSVSDTGEGIPPEHLANVFERFYRADVSRARQSGGTGLGLTIARQLIRAHGGDMGVASAVGRGTHFAFALPGESVA